MLAIRALVPEARCSPDVHLPHSPSLPIASLVAWAGASAEERTAMWPWFAAGRILEAHQLIRRDHDEIMATAELLDLVAQEPWPAQAIPGVAALEGDADAHAGVVDDFALSKLAATISASGPAAPILHIVGPRGSGRLRIASAIAKRLGAELLMTLPADQLDEPRLAEAALCEARARSAQLVITNADDVSRSQAAALVALARRKTAFLWTTNARCSRWCASALVLAVPNSSPESRRTSWEHETVRCGIEVDADTIDRLSALDLERHAIAMAARAAARIYGGRAPYEALAEIASHFSQGGHDGMRT